MNGFLYVPYVPIPTSSGQVVFNRVSTPHRNIGHIEYFYSEF